MKVFIIGLPQSGRTTISKALCQDEHRKYIDASSWLKCTFREQKPGEHPQQYQDEYYNYLNERMRVNPFFIMDHIMDHLDMYDKKYSQFIIDGIASPKDFVHLFDCNSDYVIFLNRTDNAAEHKDQENIGVSV